MKAIEAEIADYLYLLQLRQFEYFINVSLTYPFRSTTQSLPGAQLASLSEVTYSRILSNIGDEMVNAIASKSTTSTKLSTETKLKVVKQLLSTDSSLVDGVADFSADELALLSVELGQPLQFPDLDSHQLTELEMAKTPDMSELEKLKLTAIQTEVYLSFASNTRMSGKKVPPIPSYMMQTLTRLGARGLFSVTGSKAEPVALVADSGVLSGVNKFMLEYGTLGVTIYLSMSGVSIALWFLAIKFGVPLETILGFFGQSLDTSVRPFLLPTTD